MPQDHLCEHCEDVIDEDDDRYVITGDPDDPFQVRSWFHTQCYREIRQGQKPNKETTT
jgi:hypothetical protein